MSQQQPSQGLQAHQAQPAPSDQDKKRKRDEGYTPPKEPPALSAFQSKQGYLSVPIGTQLTGQVDASFDCGYFITLQVGGCEFRGVLYTAPQHLPSKQQRLENGAAQVVSQHQATTITRDPVLKEQKEKEKDVTKPKGSRTPFNYYSNEVRERVKALYTNVEQREISRIVGEWWSRITDEEKAKYVEMSRLDKERYQREMQAWEAANLDERDEEGYEEQEAPGEPQEPYYLPLNSLQLPAGSFITSSTGERLMAGQQGAVAAAGLQGEEKM